METVGFECPHLNRQVALARPIFLLLALTELLEHDAWKAGRGAAVFVAAYLALAVSLLVAEVRGSAKVLRLPLAADLLVLAVFLALTPSVSSFWLIYLFVIFAAAIAWGVRSAVVLAGGFALALLVRTALLEPAHWPHLASWVGLGEGSYAAAAGMAFLGERVREHFVEQRLLDRLSTLLELDRGFTESLRELLEEIRSVFGAGQAWLAIRDNDAERIFIWRVRPGDAGPLRPEELPEKVAEVWLLDDLNTSVVWNSAERSGGSSVWDRQDRRRAVPSGLLELVRCEASLRSLLSTAIKGHAHDGGRIFLWNAAQTFSAADLRRLERIVHHLNPQIENLFQLRSLRAGAIEGERSRLSRDLHDGVLQTLLSLDIQLDVLRQKLPEANGMGLELESLRKTVRREGEDLRRMVTDLRPVHVRSADLAVLMSEFAERFRRESGLAVDLFLGDGDIPLSDRLCRELFQIYREAMYNVRKHAGATHVVVELFHDDSQVSLVVDDNGRGFSFEGRYSSEDLDRLRLGPISIKERARSISGTLTVESNPGHGSKVRVDIPVCRRT